MVDESTRIKILQAYLGLSTPDFAKKLGVHYETLRQWKLGKATPGLRGGKALARVMKRAGLVLRADGYPVPKERK